MRDDAYLDEEAGRRATARAAARPRSPRTCRAGGCSTSAAGPGCCSTRRAGAATRRSASSSRARRPRTRARRSASTCASSRSRTSPTTTASTSSCSPTCSSTSTTRSTGSSAARRLAAPGRRAVRRHARPGVAHRAAGRPRAGGATCPRTPACCRARTLRELLAARGLVVSADVPLVRTLLGRRWAGGLAERARPARARRSSALARRLPARPR